MHMLGKRIVDCFELKYHGNLLKLLKLYRPKHMQELTHLHYPWTIIGRSMEEVDWQRDWARLPIDKKWAIYKNLAGMSGWKGSKYLKSKYVISGCRFLLYEVSYVQDFTVIEKGKNRNLLKSCGSDCHIVVLKWKQRKCGRKDRNHIRQYEVIKITL